MGILLPCRQYMAILLQEPRLFSPMFDQSRDALPICKIIYYSNTSCFLLALHIFSTASRLQELLFHEILHPASWPIFQFKKKHWEEGGKLFLHKNGIKLEK